MDEYWYNRVYFQRMAFGSKAVEDWLRKISELLDG